MQFTSRTILHKDENWTLYRGMDEATGQRFLVKELRSDSPCREALRARLVREVGFLKPFDHPAILKPAACEAGLDRAVFEDVQSTLERYLQRSGPLCPARVARILLQLASGLEALHARRKGHGSLCPRTVLVGPRGEVKLGDFVGFDLGSTGISPPEFDLKYLAPEMIDGGAGRCGPPADLYNLGFLALQLLAGDRFDSLFGLHTGARWLSWHADPAQSLQDWRGALSHVPSALLDIVGRLIAKRPAERGFATAAALRLRLEESGLACEQFLPAVKMGPRARGRKIGPFRIVRRLHRDAKGATYLARWKARDDRQVALHLQAVDFQATRTLARHLDRLDSIRSGCLVRIYRGGAVPVDGGWAWFTACEYMPNGSLAERIRTGKVGSLDQLRRLAMRVARGLAELHEKGLAHGRVNAGCILFDGRGQARLGGFHVPHAAPEKVSPREDLRALGRVLKQAFPYSRNLEWNELVDSLLGAGTDGPTSARALHERLRGPATETVVD